MDLEGIVAKRRSEPYSQEMELRAMTRAEVVAKLFIRHVARMLGAPMSVDSIPTVASKLVTALGTDAGTIE